MQSSVVELYYFIPSLNPYNYNPSIRCYAFNLQSSSDLATKLLDLNLEYTEIKGRCFLELKSVLLEVGYIEKWPKFAYLESKVPHLKFRVMRDRVYKSMFSNQYNINHRTGPRYTNNYISFFTYISRRRAPSSKL